MNVSYRLTQGRLLTVFLFILLTGAGVAALLNDYEASRAQDYGYYRYDRLRASNGVDLHVLRTTPEHVRLQAIESNVTATPYTGINGGFFWEGALLSIAVVNDAPLKGAPGDYGSGWYNTGVDSNLKRGTLVWDAAAQRYSVQLVSHAGELNVTDKLRYWAQGGVSMHLADERSAELALTQEQMPSYDQPHMRSALVYDQAQRLYMIVTPTRCTIAELRSAIIETLGPSGLVDGVYLDGDGSSQLQSGRIRLTGDRREVYQMLAIVP
ncbi:phosphodiester glycosidase family protein [Paenibacillus chartarius]|uniref:Phosphodiester glycosidase family protein n=1 Tax=Paenibacillus chartarius TaxID=747481 RepID=A0ABV6DL31_9BACL